MIYDFSRSKRISQLEDQCAFLSTKPCDTEGRFCSYEYQFCDGVANCFNAEDEELETCMEKNIFSELATIECLKADIKNLNITIKAVKCDGKVECQGGIDEDQCSLPDIILIIILANLVIFNVILAALLWKLITKDLECLTDNNYLLTSTELGNLHGSNHLKTVLFQMQNSNNVELLHKRFYDMEMEKHEGNQSEVICCIKVSY